MATTKPRATQIRGLAKQQAPYLFNIIPDSYLPDSTGDVDIYGEFFTPDMTVSADGQTVNYFTFINSGHIKVNMTRGSAEGTFGLTLNNGIEAYFSNVLLIVLGTVYEPTQADWVKTGNIDDSVDGELKIITVGSSGSVVGLNIPVNVDFRLSWRLKVSELLPNPEFSGLNEQKVELLDNSGNVLFSVQAGYPVARYILRDPANNILTTYAYWGQSSVSTKENLPTPQMYFERKGDIISFYDGLANKFIYAQNANDYGDFNVRISANKVNYFNIKKIILAT